MKKLLVTGASGFLGWNVIVAARESYQVTGLFHSNPFSCPGVVVLHADLCNEDQVVAAIATVQPDIVIHCAAASKPAFCEEHPEASREINVNATIFLARLCQSAGIKFVFTSTDLVFDGSKGNYAEDDETGPLMLYGHQKLEAESYILSNDPKAVVCRMPLMFGKSNGSAGSFIQDFRYKLDRGDTLHLFTDEYRSVLFGEDAALGLLWAAEHAQGLIHLGGKENMSRYEFGLLMCEELGYSNDLIRPALQADFPGNVKRSANATLNSRFAYASGFNPRNVKEGIRSL